MPSSWVPDSDAKTLVDSISDIVKYKHHLIPADVVRNLEELKTQLEKLRQLMPNFFDSDDQKRRTTVLEMSKILGGCEDAVDCVYGSCSHLQANDWRLFKWLQILIAKRQTEKARRQIEEAGDKVKQINEEIMKMGYQVLHSRDHQKIVNPKFSTVGVERVIGFDSAAAEVVELLTTGAEHLEAISIFGERGTGKTTLAKMVYDDHQVQSQFKVRAFAHASWEYSRWEVLLEILSCLTLSNDKVTIYELEKQIYQLLEGKQYLIVLDNVQSVVDWEFLNYAFPINRDKRCRVLITTRSHEVAQNAIGNPESIHWLALLTPESSRELLRWRVFGENNCPIELREYESKIVKKSRGNPLVLSSAATMLRKHLDRVEWWKEVSGTLSDDPNTYSSGYALYKHLPNHLKPCLLYVAAISRGAGIPVWKLFRLWISEGFILHDEENGSLSLEDIAEQYLEQLVEQNCLMVSKRRSNGRIRMCNITSTFLCFYGTMAERESIISAFDPRYRHSNSINVRRIAIDFDSLETVFGTSLATVTRPLLISSRTKTELEMACASQFLKHFKLLKLLHAESLFFKCFPDQFWSLVLLKYLVISGNIESLPSTLSKVECLQTLIVNTTSPTLQIKADIWEMRHFRHLHTNSTATFPCQVTKESQNTEEGDSNNVRTLCYISPKCCRKEVFHWTTKLRKLGIRGTLTELFESSLLEHLQKLKYLENLKLLNCSNSLGQPPEISFPKQLTKLTLSNTRLNWKEMRTVGELEKLEILKLKECAFVGENWKTKNGGFLHLRHLHIGHTDLIVWEASDDDFPKLMSLEISGCNQLWRIPRGMADIQSLQSVCLHNSTSPGLAYSLKRMRVVKFLQTNRKNFEISVFPPQE